MSSLITTSHHPKTVGIIGLGLVGNALAYRLHQAGYGCVGFDINEQSRTKFEQPGFKSVSSIEEVLTLANTILLTVYDTNGVIQVIEEILDFFKNPTVYTSSKHTHIIDCSTGDPKKLEDLSSKLSTLGLGIYFIEAPLSGSSLQIQEGTATLLLGGEKSQIENIKHVLDSIALSQVYVGKVGMAARAKLATNLVLGLNRAALAEGMVFAEKMGIDRKVFLDMILQTPARSEAASLKGEMMVNKKFEPQSRIRQHLKDVDLMIAAARSQGQRLPLSETHATLMKSAVNCGDGELDNAAIIRQIQREIIT